MRRHLRSLVCWFALCVFLGSCGKRLPEPIRVSVDLHQIYYSDESKLTQVGGTAIRNRNQWREYWANVTGSDATPRDVDFRSEMVLAYNAGRMRPGDRVQILEVQAVEEESLVVWFRIDECGTLESEVFPVQIVRVPKREGRVEFQRRTSLEPICR